MLKENLKEYFKTASLVKYRPFQWNRWHKIGKPKFKVFRDSIKLDNSDFLVIKYILAKEKENNIWSSGIKKKKKF
jgi:hypothetical protein